MSRHERGSSQSKAGMSKVKFLCSAFGVIKFADAKLWYVGGETRIHTVSRDIRYSELMFKLTEYYDNQLTVKYLLPDMDLDTLLSVGCDEDLTSLMEEYDEIVKKAAEGKEQRLRLFVFSEGEKRDYGYVGGNFEKHFGMEDAIPQEVLRATYHFDDAEQRPGTHGQNAHFGIEDALLQKDLHPDSPGVTNVGNSLGPMTDRGGEPVYLPSLIDAGLLAPSDLPLLRPQPVSILQQPAPTTPVPSLVVDGSSSPLSARPSGPPIPPLESVLSMDPHFGIPPSLPRLLPTSADPLLGIEPVSETSLREHVPLFRASPPHSPTSVMSSGISAAWSAALAASDSATGGDGEAADWAATKLAEDMAAAVLRSPLGASPLVELKSAPLRSFGAPSAVTGTSRTGGVMEDWDFDVFISHAGTRKRLAIESEGCFRCMGLIAFVDMTALDPGDKADIKMSRSASKAPVGLVLFDGDFVLRKWPMAELKLIVEADTLLPVILGMSFSKFEEAWRESPIASQLDPAFFEQVKRTTFLVSQGLSMSGSGSDQLALYERRKREEICFAVTRMLVEVVCSHSVDRRWSRPRILRILKAVKFILRGGFGELKLAQTDTLKRWLKPLKKLALSLLEEGQLA